MYNSAGSLAPYTERNGQSVAREVDSLFEPPELQLSPEEKLQAKQFAESLFAGRLGDLTCEATMDLEQLRQRSATESLQTFYLGYFATGAGKDDLAKLGLDGQPAAARVRLMDIEAINGRVDDKTRKQVATNSLKWYKQELASQLEQAPDRDPDFEDAEIARVNYNPQKLLDKISDLQAYRRFYREVRRLVKQGQASDLTVAEMALLDVHVASVNYQLADLYPSAIYLAEQLAESTTSPQADEWKQKLDQELPALRRAVARHQGKRAKDFEIFSSRLAQRLDFLKNGASQQAGGSFSSITPELRGLVSELVQGHQEKAPLAELTPEILAKLEATRWDADHLKQFLLDVLADWALLSRHQAAWDEIEKRDGPAEDNKWQIAIHPKKESFGVSGAKKVAWVPEDFDRSLIQLSPAGALPLVAHELEHLLQEEYNAIAAQQIPLAKSRGRRTGTLQEAGAIFEEAKVQAAFGKVRPVNLHYFRALEAKLAGGNKLQVIRAFYDSLTEGQEVDDKKAASARKQAVDRGLRLFRDGGYNSQPLDYIEQELLTRELKKQPTGRAEVIMTAVTSFSLADTERLHRLGLLDIPTKVNLSPSGEVLRIFYQHYLRRIIVAPAA